MLHEELATNKMGVTEESTETVLVGKHPHEKIPHCSTLEVYDKTPISILVDIIEHVVELVALKLSGRLGTGGTDLEDLLCCCPGHWYVRRVQIMRW